MAFAISPRQAGPRPPVGAALLRRERHADGFPCQPCVHL